MIAWGKPALLLAAVLALAWFVHDYTKTTAENDALRAGRQQSGEVIRMLGDGLARNQKRAETFRGLYEELSHVQDDNTCHSPAIDRAFELLQRQRSKS